MRLLFNLISLHIIPSNGHSAHVNATIRRTKLTKNQFNSMQFN